MVAEQEQRSDRPEIRRYGSEFTFTWQRQGLGIAVSQLRETAGGQLKAELTIESTRPGQAGLLWWGQVTLGAQADRERVVKALVQAAPDLNWPAAIARLCQYVAYEFRKPEPLVELARVAPGEAAPLLAPPLLASGQTNIVMATGGAGKSYLALRLALSVCRGLELPWGGQTTATGPVVYYDWETDARTQRRRLERLAAGLALPELPTTLLYRRMRGRLVDRVSAMRAEIQRVGAILVVVDSLGFACGGDLNTTEVAIPTMDAIAELGEATKLVLAHYAKEHRDSRSPATVYGSAFFEFAARSIWELRRETGQEGEFTAGLFHRKANDEQLLSEPLGLKFLFEPERGRVRVERAEISESPDLSEHVPIRQRLRALLLRGPWRTDELAEELGISEANLRRELKKLPWAENVQGSRGGRGKRGVWRLRAEDTAGDFQKTASSLNTDRNEAVSLNRFNRFTETASNRFMKRFPGDDGEEEDEDEPF